jgi:hypothetical protein
MPTPAPTPARRVSELLSEAQRRLDDLVACCLAKERAERPPYVIVLLALLETQSVELPRCQREAAKCRQDRVAA